MLPANLTTNEVKDQLGAEIEFSRLSTADRSALFAKVGETYSQPHRLSINHQQVGSGTSERRRSKVRFDLTVPGQVDTTKLVTISFYVVGDIPIGNLTNTNDTKKCLANLISLLSSQGATTTILYDCTGYGAASLLNGDL